MAYLTLRLFTTACVLYQVYSYQGFRDNIPNGWNVPNPCSTDADDNNWLGVGHEAPVGGGKRNPFGLDFKAEGVTWTKALCEKDSDGDGKTNGEELGDPNCAWIKDGIPERASDISHPGICEPIGSDKCQGSLTFIKDCSEMNFKCDVIDNDEKIFTVDIQLSETKVPAKETTYMCQVIDLERTNVTMDNDYHLVATKGFIDTVEIMHHALVYGCEDDAHIPTELWSPRECFMSRVDKCEHLIGVWTIGSSGFCYHEDAGFRIGKNGFKKVVLELHWNNEEEKDSFSDASGITLYLTPNLRANDAGMFLIGQTDLEIPPYTARHTEEGTCSSECTNKLMEDDIKIVGALNHMHTLGSAATSTMVSDEGKETIISHEETYDYNSPNFVVFDDPLLMKPGYSLELKCHFDSSSRGEVTHYGEGTSEEMCFTFIMYYPRNNWKQGEDCLSHGQYDGCSEEESDCDFEALVDFTNPDTVRRMALLDAHCEPGTCTCKEGCIDVVREIIKEPCFHGENYKTIKEYMNDVDTDQASKLFVMELAYTVDSCNAELAREECRNTWTTPSIVGGATSTNVASSAFICIFTILISLM